MGVPRCTIRVTYTYIRMRFRPTGDFKTFHYEPVGWGPLPPFTIRLP
jgi:hypothetical protein